MVSLSQQRLHAQGHQHALFCRSASTCQQDDGLCHLSQCPAERQLLFLHRNASDTRRLGISRAVSQRNAVPGTPVQWDKVEDPDDVQLGYGYVPADTTHEAIFYYHTDHLGSTSYITDAKANVTQFDAYLPYGELLVDEHSSTEEMPYKLNGKEFDQETGLYYYGARYMNPVTSLWYGVDPHIEEMAFSSSYTYCDDHPVNFVDIKGKKKLIGLS